MSPGQRRFTLSTDKKLKFHIPEARPPGQKNPYFGFLQDMKRTPERTEQVELLKSGRLPRVIHWRKGKWCVVSGPFPDQFYRSETRDKPEKAAKLYTEDCYNRPATTRDDQYAKVRLEDIQELDGGENEFGPITP